MSQTPNIGGLAGKWTYRSFLNSPDLSTQFNDLEFGRGTITIEEAPMDLRLHRICIKPWPNGVNQVPAMTGSVVRTIPHSDGAGGTSPAGVVGSWIAVWQGPL